MSTHIRPLRFTLSFLLASALGMTAVAAGPEVDPKAQPVIDAFGKYYAGLKGFKFSANVVLTIEQQGQKQANEFVQSFSAQRPNKLAYALDSEQGGALVVSDGSDLSIFIKAFEKYAVEKAPADWQGLLQNQLVLGLMSPGNAVPVTAAILSDDPAKKLLEKVESVKYGGLVTLGDEQCHLLQATGTETDWQLWIASGSKPLVRQFVPDLEKALERMARQQGKGKSALGGIKISNVVVFKDWEANPKFAADAFAFTAPEGATKAKSLLDILTGGRGTADTGPHPLVGKPAPPIKLDLLDGGTLDLASFKNKKIVILDFWATWCGPCVQAMPIIERVAEKYKDQGVMLFAVNVGETADEINKFLEETKIKVPVALDSEKATAKDYKASGIPQTVLVGKDGSVQVVQVGFSPALEEQLTKKLEDLLAGKDLAAETLAAAKENAGDDDKADDNKNAAKPDSAGKKAAKSDKKSEKK